MKNYISFLLMLLSVLSFGQHIRSSKKCCEEVFDKPGLNNLASLVLFENGKNIRKSFLSEYYGINPLDSTAVIEGVLKTYAIELSDSCLKLLVNSSKVTDNIFTFSVYLKNLQKLSQLSEVQYLSLSRKAESQLGNSARKDAEIDKVHAGLNLPMPYTGKGILCGIVDVSIEYNNPAFKNETGDSLRIIRAWAQNFNKGIPPAGYKYGVEFIGEPEISNIKFDSIIGLHGTITTAAMSASGYGSNGLYKGVAPNSKIIAVTSNNSENSLLDAMSYFFTQSKKLNKKGVFNLSWGSHLGPHDGTSLFDQSIDSLVKAGGFVVGAAGNWGADTMHLKHSSGTTASTTSSIILEWDTVRYTLIDIWAKPNTSFQVQIKAVDKLTGKVGISTANVSTLKQGQSVYKLPFGKDTTTVYIIMTARDVFNKRPNCLVAFLHNHIKTNTNLSIHITSTNNTVHGWGASSALFSKKTEKNVLVPNFVSGDNQYTVGELGGTSKSIITVGTHVSQQKFKNIFGNDMVFSADSGKTGLYSSYGPTLDGRIKPDLTAPGSVFVPANSYYLDINNSPERTSAVEGSAFTDKGKTYYWLGEEATSFASPVVAGSVALLLEANPTLSFLQVKNALLNNTTTDVFTGNISLTGSPHWGFGKLNIYKAISSVISVVTENEKEIRSENLFWYSNPIQNRLTVFGPDFSSSIDFTVYDICGRIISNTNGLELISKEGSFYHFNSSPLVPGQYIVILKSDNGFSKSFKLTKTSN
ncbi:MAG: S8 family peptidase [Opitutaceae bacterium]|nr:S8 family peptidase [Cytophagales bacterium]